ncbi:MAG: T9SS type A sorting domain-containing protein [Salibacteraceae bacterium]|jgi:hypothetical protein|nr:T9SS type A sorting domain-containing protein [Salibacteraceae bacterium]
MRFLFIILAFSPILGFSQGFSYQQKVTDNFRNSQIRSGYEVDISDSFAFVGSPEDSRDANNANPMGQTGSVSVFKRDNAGNWNFHQKLTAPTRIAQAYFGWAISADEDRVAIGAFQESTGINNSGAAYTFVLVNDTWQVEQQIFPSDPHGQARFGSSIAIYDSLMVVGAYSHPLDTAGANYTFEAGSAYFFERINGIWTEIQKATQPVRYYQDRFGWSVAIHKGHAAIGAPRQDFDENGLNYMVNSGAIYHYIRNTTDSTWQFHEKIVNNPRGGEFGRSISIVDSFLFSGSPLMSTDTFSGDGFATLFKLDNADSFQIHQQIDAPVKLNNDNYGHDVDLFESYAVVGVPFEDHDIFEGGELANTGSMYAYQFLPGTDTLTYINKLSAINSERKQSDWVGWSAAISNTAAIGGAPNQDWDINDTNYVNNAGAAYIFDTICPIQTDSTVLSICEGDSALFGTQYYSQSGQYSIAYPNQIGCDSILVLDLTVLPTTFDSVSVTTCDEYVWSANGTTYNQSGNYTKTLTNSLGCDSLVELSLTIINSSAVTTIQEQACDSFYWDIADSTYFETGVFEKVYTNVAGCDSVIVLDLEVTVVDTSVQVYGLGWNTYLEANADSSTYRWFYCFEDSLVLANATAKHFFADSYDSNYFAVEITTNGCVDTSNCHLALSYVGIKNMSIDDLISVFPNPANLQITIKLDQFESAVSYEIRDLTGRLVLNGTSESDQFDVNVSALPSGPYFLEISSELGRNIQQISVIR